MKTVTVPIETIQCLREHLKAANDLFNSLAGNEGNAKRKSLKPRETHSQKVKKYLKKLES